jgi:ribonuclease BN (tRNA processing enzyme)
LRVKLLNSADNDRQSQYATSFIVNDIIAIDAGVLGFHGAPDYQARIHHVFLTHSHADHLASLPIFLENAFDPKEPPAIVYGTKHTIEAVTSDVLNDRVWPDFLRLSNPERPFLRLQELVAEQEVAVEGFRILPVTVDHLVPTVGFIMHDNHSTVIFGADSGPTNRIWELARDTPTPRFVFLEACFPDNMNDLARVSGHLTPALFAREVNKMPQHEKVIAVHLKARFRSAVIAELQALGLPQLEIGKQGTVYEF